MAWKSYLKQDNVTTLLNFEPIRTGVISLLILSDLTAGFRA